MLQYQMFDNTNTSANKIAINDRLFWIYLIIAIFFIIIGISSLIMSEDKHVLLIILIWILSNIALLITIYHISLNWYPENKGCSCFKGNKYVFCLIYFIFVSLLILGILWASKFHDINGGGNWRSLSGIFIIMGGLALLSLSSHCNVSGFTGFIIPFWSCVCFLVIWVGLTIYTLLQ